MLLSSSGGVQSNSGVAQGMEEVEPCSQSQMGTYLQQLLDKGSPCCQQQEEGPGRSHSAGEGVHRDSHEGQVEVGRSHSSFQVKGSHKRQNHSGQERHEKHLWPV